MATVAPFMPVRAVIRLPAVLVSAISLRRECVALQGGTSSVSRRRRRIAWRSAGVIARPRRRRRPVGTAAARMLVRDAMFPPVRRAYVLGIASVARECGTRVVSSRYWTPASIVVPACLRRHQLPLRCRHRVVTAVPITPDLGVTNPPARSASARWIPLVVAAAGTRPAPRKLLWIAR